MACALVAGTFLAGRSDPAGATGAELVLQLYGDRPRSIPNNLPKARLHEALLSVRRVQDQIFLIERQLRTVIEALEP